VIELLLAVAALVAASLLVGTLACRLCGIRTWTWIAGPVGLSLLMLLGLPSLHAPGRMAFAAAVTLLLAIAGVVLMVREPALRPPRWAPLAMLPTLLLGLVPFAANARVGTLGVGFNNDMAAHLLLAEGLRSPSVAAVNGLISHYPLGPHAVAAFTGVGLGIDTDIAFLAFTLAVPLLTAGVAAEILAPLRLPARILGATLTAAAYLAASYYAQGAFKELVAILLTMGVVAAIPLARTATDVRRYVPIGLLLAGMVGAYSYPGLIWPVATLCVWLAAVTAPLVLRRRWTAIRDAVRGALLPVALGAGATVVVLLPQAARIKRFYDWNAQVGVRKDDIGNLAGPISPGEALGVWLNPDFRFDPLDMLPTTLWLVVVGAALVGSLVVWVRRADLAAPAALVAGALIWIASDQDQSPYVVAKALAIASPFVLLLLSGALFLPRPGPWRGRRLAPVLVGLAIAGAALWSSFGALRGAQVGSRDHQRALAAVRADLHGQPTLFLGVDDFVQWELAGQHVVQPLMGALTLPTRPEKAWAYGQGFDADTFPTYVMDSVSYVVTPRDASASRLPANFVLEARHGPYDVYHRTGPTVPHAVLGEGPDGTALLDCSTPEGRALSRGGGVAAVRGIPVRVPLPPIAAGATARLDLSLTKGIWDLSIRYVSPQPITVWAPGLLERLPAVTERPGPAWPAGSVTVPSGRRTVPVAITADRPLLAPTGKPAVGLGTLLAVPRTPERLIPMAEACDRWVDWYLPAGSRPAGR